MSIRTPALYFPAFVALLLSSLLLIDTTDAAPSTQPSSSRQSPSPPLLSSIQQAPLLESSPPPPPSPNSPPPPTPSGCSPEVISFAPCLPYISAPPNNITDKPTPHCCYAFVYAFRNSEANCLCYLVRQPSIFGFPLNTTKLYSLSSICPEIISRSPPRNASLQSVCSASRALPPLRSTSGSGLSKSHNSGSDDDSVASSPNIPLPDFDDDSPPPESVDGGSAPSAAPLTTFSPSSASKELYKSRNWFLSHTMIIIVHMLCCL